MIRRENICYAALFNYVLAIAFLLHAFAFPVRADDNVTPVMSPVVSYQFFDSAAESTNAPVSSLPVSYQFYDVLVDLGSNSVIVSPTASYEFYDRLGAETNSIIISPIASYQFFDWPSNLTEQYSLPVSFYYPGIDSVPVTLHGCITDARGAPLSAANVSVVFGNIPVSSTNTDARGNYSISLGGGAYAITVSAPGYATSSRSLVLSPATDTQNFQLAVLAPPPNVVQVNRQNSFVFPPIGSMGEQLQIFDGTQFIPIDPNHTPSPNQMTVVMTHGWNSDPTVWAQNIASNMVRVGVTANILAWDWRYGANSLYPPEEYTPAEGVLLGQALQSPSVLGANYSQPIHFIGHSLGTMVNASAINYVHGDKTAEQNVSPTVWSSAPIHVTLLDEAEGASLFLPLVEAEWYFDGLTANLVNLGVPLNGPPSGAVQGWKTPIPINSTWIDNYISKFGVEHTEAINVFLAKATLLPKAPAQHAYAYQWYQMTVINPNDCVLGFQRSYEAQSANLTGLTFPPSSQDFPAGVEYMQPLAASDPLTLIYQPSISQVIGDSANSVVQALTGTAEVVGSVTTQVESATQSASETIGQGFSYVGSSAMQGLNKIVNYVDSSALQISLTSSSGGSVPLARPKFPMSADVSGNGSNSNASPMIWLPIQFPLNAAGMAFDFSIAGNPSDDWLVCGIGTNNLFSLQAKYIPTNTVSASRLIDVSAWAGTTNELFFGFLGGSSTNATLTIDNIRFYSLQLPTLQIQPSGGNLAISWPLSAQGYSVQATTNPAAPNSWATLTNLPTVVNSLNMVTNPASFGAMFYRLKK